MKSNRYLILLLLLALFARLLWIVLVPTEPISDFEVFDKLAMSVVNGQGYTLDGDTPSTYRPPGYPLFLAGIYAVCGHSWLAARVVNALLGVATCWLTYLLAVQLFDRRAGLLSALIVALFPSHIMYGNILTTENLFMPLLLGACYTFLRAVRQENARHKHLLATGVLLGMGVLTRPAILPLPAVWAALLLWKRVPLRQALLMVSVIVLAMLAIIVPWTIRNAVVSGELILVASEGGITFLAGHNERSTEGTYSLEGPVFDELFAVERSEAELDAYAYKLAFRFICHNPKTELVLPVHKFIHFFKYDVSGVTWNVNSTTRHWPQWLVALVKVVAQGYYMLVAVLAMASLFLKRLPRDRWYVVLLGLFAYWTAIHLAFYGKDRFRLPIMPVYAMFAAVTLGVLWDNVRQRLASRAG